MESPPRVLEVAAEDTKGFKGSRTRGRKDSNKPQEEAGNKITPRERSGGRKSFDPSSRPVREKKPVDRFVASHPGYWTADKEVSIKKGRGTQLKDIPNVAFKLSKRKVDENLQILHRILFGRRSKSAYHLKRNIYQFSGFVWEENEEQQRAKLKEKVNKCFKRKLLEFCDMLDIPVSKASKKEDILAKLFNFLESPSVSRQFSTCKKEQYHQDKDWKRKAEGSNNISSKLAKTTTKKIKISISKNGTESNEREQSSSEEKLGYENGGGSEACRGSSVDEDNKDKVREKHCKNADGESEGERCGLNVNMTKAPKLRQKENVLPPKKGPTKQTTIHLQPCSMEVALSNEYENKEGKSEEKENDAIIERKRGWSFIPQKSSNNGLQIKSDKEKAFEKKYLDAKVMEDEESHKKRSPQKPLRKGTGPSIMEEASSHKMKTHMGSTNSEFISENEENVKKEEGSKVSNEKNGKKQGELVTRASTPKGENKADKMVKEPSRKEIYSVICSILKEADFNTATLSDIIKQLGSHFKIDLMDRKSEMKDMIEDAINSMTDDEEKDEREYATVVGKDGSVEHEDGR